MDLDVNFGLTLVVTGGLTLLLGIVLDVVARRRR